MIYKFYCLKHPERGYLSRYERGYTYNTIFKLDISKSKKWNYKNSLKTLLSQTTNPLLRECDIVEVSYQII